MFEYNTATTRIKTSAVEHLRWLISKIFGYQTYFASMQF
jgi:hypothetical protein